MEPVFITRIELINSKHGNEVIEVKFKGIKTHNSYVTWIDPTYKNWSNWQHIIEVGNTKGIVLSNIKLKDVEKGVVNADCEPKLECVVTFEVLAELLGDYWDNQDNFNRMFGTDD